MEVSMTQTRTEAIFELSAPYANPYQGTARRVVFCCLAGLLRSATAAHLGAARHGMNTRCVGIHEVALQPLSVNLIEWANQIVFMSPECYSEAERAFSASASSAQLRRKALVWVIQDDHDYMAPRLVEELTPLLDQLHESPFHCPY